MSLASPIWLLVLLAVPVLLVLQALGRRRARRYAVRFPALAVLREAAGTVPGWRRRVPMMLALLALALLGVALARPRLGYRQPVGEASIVLVTDHSGSMAATDVSPTRLAAVQKAANEFIDRLPANVSLGAIGFSTSVDGAQAPVTDHRAARQVIDSEQAGGSTATGDALSSALQMLRGADPNHPPSAIVLLSDGAANSGQSPVSVAHQARSDHIPIYTVALGTSNGTLPNPDPLGPPVPVPPDPQLMQQVAQTSGGRFFNAQDAGTLSAIYQGLGSRLGTVARYHKVSAEFAGGALVLLLLAAIGSARWSGRLP